MSCPSHVRPRTATQAPPRTYVPLTSQRLQLPLPRAPAPTGGRSCPSPAPRHPRGASRPGRPCTRDPPRATSYLRAREPGARGGRGGCGQRDRGGGSGRVAEVGCSGARARSLPRSLHRLPDRAQPRCRAPPASPRLITTAPRVRWPRADRAAIGSAGSAVRRDWSGGGASSGAGRGRSWRLAGRGGGRGQAWSAPLCPARALCPLRLQRPLHQ